MNCYSPIIGVDDVIASKVEKWNKHSVAALRGMYDDANPDNPLDTAPENLNESAKKLVEFSANLAKQRTASISNVTQNIGGAILKFQEKFNVRTRIDRVNLIASWFSGEVGKIHKQNPHLSREQIIQGFVGKTGAFEFGQGHIFEKLYSHLLKSYTGYKELSEISEIESDKLGYKFKSEEIGKMLEYWPVIVTLARVKLRDTEGMKLSNHYSYAVETTINDFLDEDLEEIYTAEEAPRESFQQIKERFSAFSTLGKEIKVILANLDSNEKDDFGILKKVDPVKVYQVLLGLTSGVHNHEEMMDALNSVSENSEYKKWITELVDLIKTPNNWSNLDKQTRKEFAKQKQLQSKLFHAVNKVFQPYGQISFKENDGVVTAKTKRLNRADDGKLYSTFMMRIISKRPYLNSNSLFDSNGNVIWNNLLHFKNVVNEKFKSVADQTNIFEEGVTALDVLQLLNSLGIDAEDTTIHTILDNVDRKNQLSTILRDLVSYGIDSVLDNQKIKIIESGRGEVITPMAYADLLEQKLGSKKEAIFREKIEKLLGLLHTYGRNIKVEPKVRAMGKNGKKSTYHSLVEPSFMGNLFKRIFYYAENNESEKLKQYIEDNYLNSSFFKEGNKIYSYWLRAIYNSKLKDPNSFARKLEFERILGQKEGSTETAFEDISDKDHMLQIMQYYLSLEQKSKKKDYGIYPTFIQGDSGNTRGIVAPRLDMKTLREEFFNIYTQEKIRMAQSKAFEEALVLRGKEKNISSPYKPNENLSNHKNEYSYLKFLNPDFALPGQEVGKYNTALGTNPTKDKFIQVLNDYMADQIKLFINDQLAPMGLMEMVTTSTGRTTSKYFSQNVNTQTALENLVEDFFWNYKFATIQQLQILSVDPAFFKHSKEFQKRNKAPNANKTDLDVDAVDFNGDYYLGNVETTNSDGTITITPNIIMNTAYIEDIKVNGEVTNPNQMEAVLYNHFDPRATTLEEVKRAISEGIITPLSDETLEKERLAKIRKMMGRNWFTYDSYRRNTLTDGAGWRTLTGYRKVMGTSKENWNIEMEEAYNTIQSIRSKYKNTDKLMSEEDIKVITDLSVIFRPIKPLFYGFENFTLNTTGDKLFIPVQIKDSEILVIPELYPPGSVMREMMTWAENNDVDLIVSTEAVKSGNFGAATIENVTNKDEIHNAMGNAFIHQLNYKNYGIQTNVPDHVNESSLYGTQIRKMILSYINKAKDYSHYFNGKIPKLYKNSNVRELTGKNLITFYNSLIISNIMDSLAEVDQVLGDNKQLSKMFIQNIINNNRSGLDALIAYSLTQDDKFIIPLFEGVMEDDTMKTVLSIFKKNVNKQRIKGGSAVQASGLGIHRSKIDGGLQYVHDQMGNPIYAEVAMGFNISITDINGNEVPLNYEDYVNPDGSLKQTRDGKNLIEVHYPGVLDMVAYRIPTEGLYSAMNLKVVKFLPKSENGAIRVPALGTTNVGFDFDIDKLYFMRKEFSQLPVGDEMNQQLWEDFYSENDAVYNILLETRKNSPVKYSKLYEYWEESSLPGTYQNAIDDYFKRNAHKYVKFEQYNFDKVPYENTRIARNNILFELIRLRLSDPETARERTTVGGFNNPKRAARFARELMFGDIKSLRKGRKTINSINDNINPEIDPEPNYDVTEPNALIIYNKLNQIAAKLIGIFANQNTNQAYASVMEKFAIAKPIRFADHTKDGLSNLKSTDEEVMAQIHELLSSSVDAVKDQVLNYLNFTVFTSETGALLARLGYTFEEIGLLLNQPVIKRLVQIAERDKLDLEQAIALEKERVRKAFGENKALSVVDEQIDFNTERLIENILVDREVKNGIVKEYSKDFLENQLKILDLFTEISIAASALSDFINATKFTASNGVPSTIGGLYSQQIQVSRYLENLKSAEKKSADKDLYPESDEKYPLIIEVSPIKNRDLNKEVLDKLPISDSKALLEMETGEYIEKVADHRFGIEQAMYDANRRILKAIEKFTPYGNTSYVAIRELLADLSRYSSLDDKSIDTIHKELPVYILSQMGGTPFHGQTMYDESKNITNREYYTKVFPIELYNTIQSDASLRNNPLFQQLDVGIVDVKVGDKIVQQPFLRLSEVAVESIMKELFKDSWSTLEKDIAEKLFMYNFYTMGFSFSHNSFIHMVPNTVKLKLQVDREWGMSYIDFYNALQEGELDFLIDPEDFAKQHMLNHLNNSRYSYSLRGNALTAAKKLYIKNQVIQDSFEVDVSEEVMTSEQRNEFLLGGKKSPGEYVFKPILIMDGNVYVADGIGGTRFNHSKGPSMTYVKTYSQGTTNVSMQYNGVQEKVLSALEELDINPIPSLNSLTEQVPSPSIPSKSNTFSAIGEAFKAKLKTELEEGSISKEEFESKMQLANNVFNNARNSKIESIVKGVRAEVKENGLIDKVTNKKGC